MILTLMFCFIFIIGLSCLIVYSVNPNSPDLLEIPAFFCTTIGFIGGLICLVLVLSVNIGVENEILINRITYSSLLARVEISNSEYEDVSKTTIISDVAEWNKNVTKAQYYANNPWTSWFYNKEVVDDLECIELEGYLYD